MNNDQEPLFDAEKIEHLLKNVKSLEDLTGKDGVFQQLFKKTIDRILTAEQEKHLGYEPYKRPRNSSRVNSRNGYSKKTLKTSSGDITIDVPRDRDGTFEPQFIGKHQRTDPDLEKRVISLYSKGMTVRDITAHLSDVYGTEVSAALVSKVTDNVMEEVRLWQQRPLEKMYPVVFLDCIFYKVRHDNKVINKASYTALAITKAGTIEILGMWLAETEGAHFWLSVLTDLKTRGLEDILIACVDGLKGFPEAIENMYPQTQVQQCIVHQIRNSLRYVGSKHQKEFLADLKTVYQAPTLSVAETNLDLLAEKWGERYPIVTKSWQANWVHLSGYFTYPPEIRRMIYTTNIVEALHRQFRKVTKSKAIFPTDQSVTKMLYLAIRDIESKSRCKQNWATIVGQLKIVFGDRITLDLKM